MANLLNHVFIAVADMEAALVFYRDALEMEVFADEILVGEGMDACLMEKGSETRMVLVADPAGNMVELIEWRSHPLIERPAEHQGMRSRGLCEVCFLVDDLEHTRQRLQERGFSFRTPVWQFSSVCKRFTDIDMDVTHVVDPDGVQVELVQLIS